VDAYLKLAPPEDLAAAQKELWHARYFIVLVQAIKNQGV
jgi:hypothetical protein